MAPDRGVKVLIADPDPVLLRQLQKRLEEAKIDTDCVREGRAALANLRQHVYAVMLIDVALPHTGSERVLDFVRQLPLADRPVVLVLADAHSARSLDVEVVQIVLRKPYSLRQLAELIQCCVETALAHREEPGPAAQQAIA
jgi:CheY-like chemotaxis protein